MSANSKPRQRRIRKIARRDKDTAPPCLLPEVVGQTMMSPCPPGERPNGARRSRPRPPVSREEPLSADLVIASNRGPLSLVRDEDGRLVSGHAAGGLAPSLARALEGRSAVW